MSQPSIPAAPRKFACRILERISGLRFNRDFYCGYSPERINPGDAQHRLPTIKKITSGSTPQAADFVDALYSSIITAGTHRASSIRVAEAAKVIENTQRDVNIALINELAVIFERLGIDTEEVLRAAGTKWNFLPFRPGLVGGHCIGVDPYYLTHKAQEIGYHPEMILAGRRVNDNMGSYIAQRVIKGMTELRILVAGAKILVMGLAFKENCPDLRNSKVMDVVRTLESFGADVAVYDPWVNAESAKLEYGINLLRSAEEECVRCRRDRSRAPSISRHGHTPDPLAGQGDAFAFRRQISVCGRSDRSALVGCDHEDARHRRRRLHRLSHGTDAARSRR